MRGDLVIIDFSSTSLNAGVRPGLVVQNDADNSRMQNTIVVQVTTNTRRAAEPTQHLVNETHNDWSLSGLRRASMINYSNVATVSQADVLKTIVKLSATTMAAIDDCLRAALALT